VEIRINFLSQMTCQTIYIVPDIQIYFFLRRHAM